MQKFLIIGGLVLVLGLGGLFWWKSVQQTPEQIAAQVNLDLLDRIEETWTEHDSAPRDDLFDEKPFHALAADLRKIDLSEATQEVKAIHVRYTKFAAGGPEILRQFRKPPPEAPAGNVALQQRAQEDWAVHLTNMGIQLEVLLRNIDTDIEKLRAKYKKDLKG